MPCALSPRMAFSNAAGISTSHSSCSSVSWSTTVASGNPTTVPVCCLWATTAAGSSPSGFTTPPRESLTARMRAPAWL